MKVRELIAKLEDYDQDARVYIMTQPSWPFENEVAGVIERAEFEGLGKEGARSTDVFVLEGDQVRYGSKKAWEG